MSLLLSLLSYVAGIACFVRLFLLASKLAVHRKGPLTTRQYWTQWLPGEFDMEGNALRRRITRLFVLAFAFLALGIWLGRGPASW